MKLRSFIKPASYADCTFMRFHNLFCDGQPKPRTACKPITGLIRPVKAFKDIRQIFRRNSVAGVAYDQ